MSRFVSFWSIVGLLGKTMPMTIDNSDAARWLIVTADDFGLSHAINEGIIHAFHRGIVRAASLSPVGRAFDHAVSLARNTPDLDLGVHLTAVDERPACPSHVVSSLISHQRRFAPTALRALVKAAASRVSLQQLEREFRAQIESVRRRGVAISHLNCHCHLHVWPSIFRLVIRLARAYAIPWVRVPSEPIPLFHGVRSWRSAQVLLIGALSRYNVRQIGNGNSLPQFPHRVLGIEASGHVSEPWLLARLSRLEPGVTELMCHPGFESHWLRKRYRRWGRYQWRHEVEALTSWRVLKAVDEYDVRLVSFRDLMESPAHTVKL